MAGRTFIVDTDTASDDAVALIMALRHHDVDVAAVTTVAGNCRVEQATRNALYTVELCGADVPVYMGSSRPLLVTAEYATWFHGEDGLGDRGYPPPRRRHEPEPGVPALIRTIHENPGCTLVTLGPLTNVALALHQEPSLANLVDRCVVMGGTANLVGNVTPAAEFNLWFDPHAAAMVFESPLEIEMVGWELCRREAGLDSGEQAELRAIGTEIADFMLDCNATAIAAIKEQSGSETLELPDPTAMAVALEPGIIVRRSSRHHVSIEHTSPITRGMSVVDSLDVTGQTANTEIVREIDVARFKQMVFDAAR
jgi:purine nucleosidase